MENKKISLKDGFFKQNTVFMSGLFIAPVIACATTVVKSLAVCMVFSLVSFFSIILCRFIPRKISYTIRVIFYTLISSALYIPVIVLTEFVFGGEVIASAGVYLPIIVTNSLILSKTETRFFGEDFDDMTIDVLVFIGGFDISCLLTGAVRELLAKSTIAGAYVNMPFVIPALETTFGGFLFLGVFAALFRGVYNYLKNRPADDEYDEEEELLEYAEDMGEFLVGKKRPESEKTEKVKIYKSKKHKKPEPGPENMLEMSFRDNSSLMDEFAAIVAEGAELSPSEQTEDKEETEEQE